MLKTKVSLTIREDYYFTVDTDAEEIASAAIDKWLERHAGDCEDGDQTAFEKVEVPDRFSTVLDAAGNEKVREK